MKSRPVGMVLKGVRLAALILAAAFYLGGINVAKAATPAKPNIIFILADDIGYGDLGCYGAKLVKTPNVDRLARQGRRFTDAHAPASVCSPTRYALLTGQYAWRNPAGAGILSGEAPLAINPKTPNVASMLKQAGYATGIVGKWHIGLGAGDLDFNKPIKPGPLELGFDYAFFFPATGDRVPCVYVENHNVVGLDPNDPIRTSYKGKIGDEPTGAEHPELLKVKPSHGHDNTIINGISRIGFMAGGKAARWNDEEMANTLTAKAVSFIEKNQQQPFFLYLATHDIHVPRVPHPKYQGSSGCGIRGDVLQQFDGCVGAVMATLDRLKLAENTLLIVTSDNGGVMDDGYADRAIEDANGHKCNGVLRGYKGSLWEGGTREPFIVRWPGRIQPGSTSDEMICHVDMLATFAALTGQALAADAGPDSFNVLPALLGQKHDAPARTYLVTQINGTQRQAIRKDLWKLIPGGGGPRARNTSAAGAQLYNLADDLAETNDVSARNPQIVKEMLAKLEEIRTAGRSRP